MTSDPLERAMISLEGLSVGDSFGEEFFLPEHVAMSQIQARILPPPQWQWTDDTNMALSIVECLGAFEEIDQNYLAESFADRFNIARKYGTGALVLINAIGNGTPWRLASRAMFGGGGSFGNGSAMRIAPLGAYFANDMEAVLEQAVLASEITHSHTEGIAGGIAVAVAAAQAVHFSEQGTVPGVETFLESVSSFVPDSEVRSGIEKAQRLSDICPPIRAAQILGNGSAISCQDTVPFCLWSAGRNLDRYEDALWETVSVLGDIDTNCAIVGGVVAAFVGLEGIPDVWRSNREPFPNWFQV
jgi:ADP-ribosylglycohydrolase